MSKIKSAICLTLITLVIAVLCVVCFVPFPAGAGGINYFNPIINWTDKSSDLGGYQFGGENKTYYGGSFSVTIYPEGVISQKEYEDNRNNYEGEEKTKYEEKYVSYADGALYLEKETVCDGGETVTSDFEESFKTRFEILKTRFERIHSEGMSMQLVDDYSIRVTLPASLDTSIAAFTYFSYMGNLEVSYGSDLATATKLFPEDGKKAKPITDYVKGAGTRSVNGTVYVGLYFTSTGRELIANATADAANSTGTLFFTVGGDQVIGLSVTSQIDEKDLFISGSYTTEAAKIIATVIDTAIDYGSAENLAHMEMGELYQNYAGFGENSLMLFYIGFGALALLMMLYFWIRYGRLGFAHLYSFLVFMIAIVLCIWSIPMLSIGMNTITAFLITAGMLAFGNAYAYECVRKEYTLGKTMIASVKTGYKKCFWHIFDMHVVVTAIGLLLFGIGLAELSAFGLTLALGGLFSGIASLAINRFMWYIMMPFAKNAGNFCNFKREEVEDE